MAADAEIKATLDTLIAEVPSLLALAAEIKEIAQFGRQYQGWYSRAVRLLELLGPDRADEFRSYYLIDPKRKAFDGTTYVIQDYIKGVGAPEDYTGRPLWDIHKVVAFRLLNQSHILESMASRIESVLADVKGHLLAEIQDEELDVARRLLPLSHRGAGAIAGVVLEGHLQRIADNHKVPIGKKEPSIGELNDALKQAGVYEIPTWRKIQHMGDLRNLCDHQKNREPTRQEVEELILGVSAIIKTVF